MKTQIIITIVLAGISSLAFSQETPKAESTNTHITIKENQFGVTNLNAPLYILDNKEIAYAELSKIETNNINTITVLKDAKSTAKYGARGSNGVIIIELKDATKPPAHKKRSTIE